MMIVSEHIVLRSPELRDAAFLLQWENDPEVIAVSDSGGPFTLEQIQTYIRGIRDVYLDGQLRWMIVHEGDVVGTLDLYEVDFESKSAYVGVLIGEKDRRRQGIASRALTSLIEYSAEVLGLSALQVRIQQENIASVSFFARHGFVLSNEMDDITEMVMKVKSIV